MSLRHRRNLRKQIQRVIEIDQGRTHHNSVHLGVQKRSNQQISSVVQLHISPAELLQDLDPESPTFGQFKVIVDYDGLGA